MSRPNMLYVTPAGYARIACIDWQAGTLREYETHVLHAGHYVRIDDGKHRPLLCYGCELRGVTITYHSPEQLAKACNARYYTHEFNYLKAVDAAKAKLGIGEDVS